MHVAERFLDGGYVVYAAAIEDQDSTGFFAAVVVKQWHEGHAGSCEVFRDERLVHASTWTFPRNALAVAVFAGLVAVHELREALAEQASTMAA